jgi:hypothetical protein
VRARVRWRSRRMRAQHRKRFGRHWPAVQIPIVSHVKISISVFAAQHPWGCVYCGGIDLYTSMDFSGRA